MLQLRQADRTSTAALSRCLKIIETRYAAYYNNTYEREGPLFTGRFASEPIEMNIICLLHGAMYCAILPRQALPRLTPIHGAVTLIILVPVIPIRLLIRLICLPATVRTSYCSRLAALTIRKGSWNHPPQKKKCSDTDVVAKMDRICGCTTPSAFQTLSPENRARSLAVLVQQGAGVRQLARLTGIAPGMISRTVRNYNTTHPNMEEIE